MGTRRSAGARFSVGLAGLSVRHPQHACVFEIDEISPTERKLTMSYAQFDQYSDEVLKELIYKYRNAKPGTYSHGYCQRMKEDLETRQNDEKEAEWWNRDIEARNQFDA